MDPDKVHKRARFLIPDIDRWAKLHGHKLDHVDLCPFEFLTEDIFMSQCTLCKSKVYVWLNGYVRVDELYIGDVASIFGERNNKLLCDRLRSFI